MNGISETRGDLIAELDAHADRLVWLRVHLREVRGSRYQTIEIMGSSRAPDLKELRRLRDQARKETADA